MKVRWTENSIRLRITPTEMAQVLRGEPVTEGLMLPGGLRWEARIQPLAETALASEGQTVIIYLSNQDRQRLAASDAEGVYFQFSDGGLRYFVEKDYPCVHPRAAESLDTPTETFDAPEDFERRKREP